MSRTDEERNAGMKRLPDLDLWQRCRMIDAPEDEAARFLDLAAFADSRLEPDEQDRVAALLAADPAAAADVGAAKRLADRLFDQGVGRARLARATPKLRRAAGEPDVQGPRGP